MFRAMFAATIAVFSIAACGGSTSADLTGSGGSGNAGGSGGSGNASGSGGAGGNNAKCPPSFPNFGTTCTLPKGTTCTYAQNDCCGPWVAECMNGEWVGMIPGCAHPPPLPCPSTPPQAGSSCDSDPCSGGYDTCTYGLCADDTPQTTAECSGGVWNVQSANCAPMPCEKLSPCQCFDRVDCKAVSDSCICECDYECPGKPGCDCICGGGKYLGCAAQ